MLLTTFSTSCPLFEKKLCCHKISEDEAVLEIKKFLTGSGYQKEFLFKKSDPHAFRLKAKLAVRGDYLNPQVGIFAKNSHDVIDMEKCLMHDPLINLFVKHLKEAIKTLHIPPYDEKHHKGILKYIQVVANDSKQLQAVLVVTENNSDLDELILYMQNKMSIHSLWLNIQKEKTNTIFGSQWIKIFGQEYITFILDGKKFSFHPGSFCQANLVFFENILKDIKGKIKNSSKALDLYSGIGLFGIYLSDKCEEVLFAETNPFSENAFGVSSRDCNFHKGKFFHEDALYVLQKNLDADLVIIDPPRKGLQKEIKPLLAKLPKGATVVYVSCGYKSLLRDLKELLDFGFEIEFIKGYDCFPGSGEIETLCILKHQDKA